VGSIGTFGDNVARGRTDIHVTTVTANQKFVTVGHGKKASARVTESSRGNRCTPRIELAE
jgi:hypothetical protein